MILVLGKASGRQRRENVSAGKRAESLPDVCPLYVAGSKWPQMTNGQVNVNNADTDRC